MFYQSNLKLLFVLTMLLSCLPIVLIKPGEQAKMKQQVEIFDRYEDLDAWRYA